MEDPDEIRTKNFDYVAIKDNFGSVIGYIRKDMQ